MIQGKFGPYSVDLMSLDSNVMKDEFGKSLKHFTPYPKPFSAGVNVSSHRLENEKNPYVFPPFGLIFPLLKFFNSTVVRVCTMAVPLSYPKPIWWPFLLSCRHNSLVLGRKGDKMFCWYHRNKVLLQIQKVLYRTLKHQEFNSKCFHFIYLDNRKFSKN